MTQNVSSGFSPQNGALRAPFLWLIVAAHHGGPSGRPLFDVVRVLGGIGGPTLLIGVLCRIADRRADWTLHTARPRLDAADAS